MAGIPLRLVLSLLIAFVAIVTFLVSFLPTYMNGIKAIDTTVQDLRSATATAVSNSVNDFYLSTWNSVVQLQTLADLNLINISDYEQFQFYMAEKSSSNRGYLSQTQYVNEHTVQFSLHDNTLDSEYIFHQRYIYENSSYFGNLLGFVNHSNPSQWIPFVQSLPWITSPQFGPFPPTFMATESVFPASIVPEGAPNVAWGSLTWRYNSWGKSCIGLVPDGSTYGRYLEAVGSSRLNTVLNELTLRTRARVIVYDPDHVHEAATEPLGTLIGARSPLEPFELTGYFIFTAPIWDKVNSRYLHNTSDSLLSEVVTALGKDTLLSGGVIGGTSSFTVTTDLYGDTYVDVIEVNQTGLRLRVLLAMPLIDFLEEVYEARTVAIALSVACLVVVVVLSFLLGHLITLPLIGLGERMALTATFNDDDGEAVEVEEGKGKGKSPATSALAEVASLQLSYFKMRDNLMKAKSYLPESLIRSAQGLSEDDDDDDEGDLINGNTSSMGRSGAETEMMNASQSFHSKTRSGTWYDGQSKKTASDQMTARSSRSTSKASSYRGKTRGENMSMKSGLAGASGGTAAALNTSSNLQQKRISLVVFDLVNFRSIVSGRGVSGTLAVQAKALSIVHKHVKENKGLIDYFQGDHIVASFNAATNVAMHARRAATCVTAACSEVSSNATIKTRMTAGMASGTALVGNMGSTEQKRFCVVGDVFHEATRLERLARHYNVPHLVVSSNLTELETLFRCCVIDIGLVKPIATVSSPISLDDDISSPASENNNAKLAAGYNKPVPLLFLTSKDQTAMDEWMYELDEAKKKDPFHRITQAFYSLAHGDLTTARDYVMEIHEEQQKADMVATKEDQAATSPKSTQPSPRSSVDFTATMPPKVTMDSLQKTSLARLEECLSMIAQKNSSPGASEDLQQDQVRTLLVERSRRSLS